MVLQSVPKLKYRQSFRLTGVSHYVLFQENGYIHSQIVLRIDRQLNWATFSINHNFRNIWNMDLETLFGRIFLKMFDQT